jgi:hypothetical protein
MQPPNSLFVGVADPSLPPSRARIEWQCTNQWNKETLMILTHTTLITHINHYPHHTTREFV